MPKNPMLGIAEDAYGLALPLLDVTGHAYRELPQRPIMPESGRDDRDIEEVAMLRSRRLPVNSLTLTIGISFAIPTAGSARRAFCLLVAQRADGSRCCAARGLRCFVFFELLDARQPYGKAK